MSSRTSVWVGTLATVQIYIGAIWLVYEWLIAPRVAERPMALALAFALAQAVVIAAMMGALYVRRLVTLARSRRSLRMHAEISEALALQLVGIDQVTQLRKLVAQSRRDVEQAFEASLNTVRGGSRDRLIAAARELDLPAQDEAARVDTLFWQAMQASLLDRAVLTEALEDHAGTLAEGPLAKVLASDDKTAIAAALDMIRAWKRALPIANLDALVRHEDPSIRARALRAVPYVATRDGGVILAGLRDPHPDVRAAAAESAGRLRIESAGSLLERLLSDPVPQVAIAAAFALSMLPDGVPRLQRYVASPNRAAASVAFEALEKATLGRVELA